jgi:hypothetical protein
MGALARLHTLMADLKYGPQYLLLFLPLVRRVLRVLHLVRKLEQRVFDIIEAFGWGFAIPRRPDGRHSELPSATGPGC